MVEVWLPYGSSEIPVRVAEENLLGVLSPKAMDTSLDIGKETKRILDSSNLQDVARNAQRVCIALGNSVNRALLSELAKQLVEQLVTIGISSSSITLLCASDLADIPLNELNSLQIIRHDPQQSSTSPVDQFHGEFQPMVNSLFIDADLRVTIAEAKPHQLLGFSGLSDVIFPGLASNESTRAHLSNRKQKTATDLFSERVEIANSLQNTFALGFVLGMNHSPARISFGAVSTCISELRQAVQEISTTTLRKASDIVIMSPGGNPMDNLLSTAVETLPAGLTVLKREGIMIVAAECGGGHGGGEFFEWCAERKEPRYLESRLRHALNYDGLKATLLRRATEAHRIYLVSTIPDHHVEKVFGMRPARTLNSAMHLAEHALGSDSSAIVIPDASRVIPKLE